MTLAAGPRNQQDPYSRGAGGAAFFFGPGEGEDGRKLAALLGRIEHGTIALGSDRTGPLNRGQTN